MQKLLTSAELADYLGKAHHTLDQWAYLGSGPRFLKVGGHRRYRMSDVEAWLNAHASDAAA